MTWHLTCDTCHQPIRGDWTTTWTATGKETHHHPECTDKEAA